MLLRKGELKVKVKRPLLAIRGINPYLARFCAISEYVTPDSE